MLALNVRADYVIVGLGMSRGNWPSRVWGDVKDDLGLILPILGLRELLDFKDVKRLDFGWTLLILGSKLENLRGGRGGGGWWYVSFFQSSEEFVAQSAFHPYYQVFCNHHPEEFA